VKRRRDSVSRRRGEPFSAGWRKFTVHSVTGTGPSARRPRSAQRVVLLVTVLSRFVSVGRVRKPQALPPVPVSATRKDLDVFESAAPSPLPADRSVRRMSKAVAPPMMIGAAAAAALAAYSLWRYSQQLDEERGTSLCYNARYFQHDERQIAPCTLHIHLGPRRVEDASGKGEDGVDRRGRSESKVLLEVCFACDRSVANRCGR
jgi:hypothetical protein